MPRRSSTKEKSRLSSTYDNLYERLSVKLIGQQDALDILVPYIEMYGTALNTPGRPAGVFVLLGPTGSGKTHTAESLAAVLHGDNRMYLRVDCGQYQLDHEVAKLVGAPPGYLGHKETRAVLSEPNINSRRSNTCSLAILVFDEIEKASDSLHKILLSIMDKGTLQLGDATSTNFENTLILMTSNLGVRDMNKLATGLGFKTGVEATDERKSKIGKKAALKHFSPEFQNRVDDWILYKSLDPSSIRTILDMELASVQERISIMLGDRAYYIHVAPAAKSYLVKRYCSEQYGARELKRGVQREIVVPLAKMTLRREIPPKAFVNVTMKNGKPQFQINKVDDETIPVDIIAA